LEWLEIWRNVKEQIKSTALKTETKFAPLYTHVKGIQNLHVSVQLYVSVADDLLLRKRWH